MTTKNINKYEDKRIVINNKYEFEVYFKLQKLGVFVAIMIALGLFIIDYLVYLYLAEYLIKIVIVYVLYLAVYTMFSKYIIKMTSKKLSSFSAPIPRLFSNKRIETSDIKHFYVDKTTAKTRANSSTFIKQTHYNLIIEKKDGGKINFFHSLSSSEVYLVERLMKEHLPAAH